MAVLSNSTPAPIDHPAGSVEAVLIETLQIIERLIAQARIAAHDARQRPTPALADYESTAAQLCIINGLAPKRALASTAHDAGKSATIADLAPLPSLPRPSRLAATSSGPCRWRMSMADRRTFLRGLAGLPLIGGGVTLVGNPTAVAMPVSNDLLASYDQWLFYERQFLLREQYGHLSHDDLRQVARIVPVNTAADRFHFPREDSWRDQPQPSTRAAVVLAAAGVDVAGDRDA